MLTVLACGVKYPTEVQKSPTNVTNVPGFASNYSQATCSSGSTYTVVTGDSCQAIAQSHNVATGTLQAINGIFPDCTNLIAGSIMYGPPPFPHGMLRMLMASAVFPNLARLTPSKEETRAGLSSRILIRP